MGSLYEELGVAPDATAEDLRRAYRREARLRHPDLHPGREAEAEEAMRRLNSAWAILADPESRRHYDAEREPAAAADIAAARPTPAVHGVSLRLWPLVVVVLAVIVVFTAYAGNHSSGPAPATADRRCLTSIPGLDDYVPCDQPNIGRLVVEVGPDEACPVGAFRHVIQSRNRVACLTRS